MHCLGYESTAYDEALPAKLDELAAQGTTVCAMMFDIDNFKDYNDRYGHQEGDICLRKVAQLAGDALAGENAHLVRYGGEEFFVLASFASKQDALMAAEGIRETIDHAYIEHLSSQWGRVTVSVGIAFFGEGSPARKKAAESGEAVVDDLESLTKRADNALYAAKEQGRNRIMAG